MCIERCRGPLLLITASNGKCIILRTCRIYALSVSLLPDFMVSPIIVPALYDCKCGPVWHLLNQLFLVHLAALQASKTGRAPIHDTAARTYLHARQQLQAFGF